MKFQLTHPATLSTRRRELNMTIKDVAEISRVDYNKIQDFERAKYKRIDAPILEAVCYALQMHPMEVSADYEAPTVPRLTYVSVDNRLIKDYLEREGINANELARRAGVRNDHTYGLAHYDRRTIPADVARKLAKAMGLRAYEMAPALAIYPGPEGEEVYGDLLGAYGGETPEDVSPLPE